MLSLAFLSICVLNNNSSVRELLGCCVFDLCINFTYDVADLER